tara:strand:+ start:3947 stop:5245 length:1299 start_codon:yes stop_codon:yes gene_type:complete
MAGKSNTSATFFAQKKLLGKAHTSNLKVDGEEVIGSNVQSSTGLLFGEAIPKSPARTLYALQSATGSSANTIEYIQFSLQALTGTTYDANDTGGGAGSDSGESSQSSGPHTYKFVLPSNYESSSSNTRKGNGVFNNSKLVHETLGELQLIPPFYSQAAPNPYIVKVYKDDGSGGAGDEIPLLDNVDWNVDYYNGILFLQDYVASKIPAHARAFAYVGKMAQEVILSGSGGTTAAGSNTQVQFNDGGTSLGGDNGLTFNKTTDTLSTINLTGSLTKLSDGSSYMVAGSGVTITSASNGSVTISANAASDLSGMQFVTFGAEANLTNERVLTQGEGITITTANPGTIVINNTGLVSRSKKFFDVTSSWSQGTMFHPLPGINFANSGYDFNKIDVFYNGQALRSGSNYDYVIHGTGSILFNFDLFIESHIQITTF